MTRLWAIFAAILVAAIVVVGPAAAPDRKPPRIVAATMLDPDRDSRADRVRLTYSERVRHATDSDGRYPFTVAGYRIRSVSKATGKTLVVFLLEHAEPDPAAAPAIRYRRTQKQPVKDLAGNQAPAQLFTKTKPHRNAPPPPPTPLDADGDGTPDAQDCAPAKASIHPGAADTPDLEFVDSNCDGIDGTEQDAIFVSPNGLDSNPGTKADPKRDIQEAVDAAAAAKKRYLLVAFGTYKRVVLASGISIFGGYDPTSWARRDRFPDGLPLISGSPEAVLALGVKDVVLQHLAIRGSSSSGERSAYGIRALNSSFTVQRVAVGAGSAAAGLPGATGTPGTRGNAGEPGKPGSCDGSHGVGGLGGSSPAGRPGGGGGRGGTIGTTTFTSGNPGQPGRIGTPGGPGGANGNPGEPGGAGQTGENGAPGKPGTGGTSSTAGAGITWSGQNGGAGGAGQPGNGGGGGGGGGPQVAVLANDGGGNGGGGGGGGGAGGAAGTGGSAGGGSFGVYLKSSEVTIKGSTIAAGNGAAGGRGGDGGLPGAGGVRGRGALVCTSEVGAGGNGGVGGAGGRGGGGGGGAGGPSVGIFKTGTSIAITTDSKVSAGLAGAGGAGGRGGPGGTGADGEPGIAKLVHP